MIARTSMPAAVGAVVKAKPSSGQAWPGATPAGESIESRNGAASCVPDDALPSPPERNGQAGRVARAARLPIRRRKGDGVSISRRSPQGSFRYRAAVGGWRSEQHRARTTSRSTYGPDPAGGRDRLRCSWPRPSTGMWAGLPGRRRRRYPVMRLWMISRAATISRDYAPQPSVPAMMTRTCSATASRSSKEWADAHRHRCVSDPA